MNKKIILPIAIGLLCVLYASAQNNRAAPALHDSVRLLENLPYAGTDNPRQMLDLILPKENAANPLPVVVFIHGGGHGRGFGPKATEVVERFFDHHLRGEKTSWDDQEFEAVAIQRR